MKLVFGGVRGVRSVTDRKFTRFGGDTTALLVEGQEGEAVFLDAGSGLAHLESRLDDGDAPLLMAFSHFHLDHLQGLPSFGPLWHSHRRISLIGPRGLDGAVGKLVNPPFWPLRLDEASADLEFPDPSARELALGKLHVRFCPAAHPGGSLAYRIDETDTGASLVFATDIEWGAMADTMLANFLDMCTHPQPPGLLVMDGYLHPQDSLEAKGGGHSSFFDGVEVARRTGAGRLAITHHHPTHDDDALTALEKDLQDHLTALGSDIEGWFARQGQVVEVL